MFQQHIVDIYARCYMNIFELLWHPNIKLFCFFGWKWALLWRIFNVYAIMRVVKCVWLDYSHTTLKKMCINLFIIKKIWISKRLLKVQSIASFPFITAFIFNWENRKRWTTFAFVEFSRLLFMQPLSFSLCCTLKSLHNSIFNIFTQIQLFCFAACFHVHQTMNDYGSAIILLFFGCSPMECNSTQRTSLYCECT